jgi:peptidyl-prolyl cis-trans isomerase SurA
MRTASAVLTLALVLAPFTVSSPRAEVIEEIVAVVNGDIVTMTDLAEQEQVMLAEVYRQFTGAELDENVARVRENLLMDLIDRRILMSKGAMFDVEKVKEAYFESFIKQQNLPEDPAELEQVLAGEGMTVEELKDRLVEMFLPDEVLRYEVGSRVAVGDRELMAYYEEHPEVFMVPGDVTIREIVLLADNPGLKEKRRTEATRIRARAIKNGNFEELAREHSDAGTKQEGGLLGPLKKGDLSLQLEDQALSLAIGDISPVLETAYGFHIIQLVSRTDDSLQPFEEVRDELREFLESTKYVDEYAEFFERARQESEWCVKSHYMDRLPPGTTATSCDNL